MDDLVCQFASLSTHSTVCSEAFAHFINVLCMFYFCRIHKWTAVSTKKSRFHPKMIWNSWCSISQWKIDPGTHILIHQMRLGSWQCLTRCNRDFCDVSTRLAFVKVTVFAQCAAGWKRRWVSTERGERFTEEVWYCRYFFFMCSSTDSLFWLRQITVSPFLALTSVCPLFQLRRERII